MGAGAGAGADAIAARAGVSRTTLYKWWPSTDVLFAPIYYRLIYGHQPLTDGFSAEIMDVCWPGIAASKT